MRRSLYSSAGAQLTTTLIALLVAHTSAAPSIFRKAASDTLAIPINSFSNISDYDYVPPANYSGMTVGLGVSGTDEVYMVEVMVGTPPKKIRLQVDTGSSNVWMTSDACTNCDSSITKIGQSSTLSVQTNMCGGPLQGYFSGGSLNRGCFVQDTVTIAGVVMNNMSFFLASNVTGFSSQTYDGILGLRPVNESSYTDYGISGWQWLRRMQAAGLIKSASFGIALGSVADRTANTSTLTFGGVNSGQVSGNFTYVNTTSSYGYEIPMDGIKIAGKTINVDAAYTSSAAADSGATSLVVPVAVGQAFSAAYPGTVSDGDGGFYVPCNSNMSVEIGIGGKSWAVQSRDLIGRPYTDTNSTLTGLCAAHIETWPNNFTLLGDSFLKTVYTIFDADSMSLGFAHRA